MSQLLSCFLLLSFLFCRLVGCDYDCGCASCSAVNSSPILAAQVVEEEMPPPKRMKSKQKQKVKGGEKKKPSIPSSRKKSSLPALEPQGVCSAVHQPGLLLLCSLLFAIEAYLLNVYPFFCHCVFSTIGVVLDKDPDVSAPQLHFSLDQLTVMGDRGWCMAKASHS